MRYKDLPRVLLLLFVGLLFITSCSKAKQKQENAQTQANQQASSGPHTDSVYVVTYVNKIPAFKQHLALMKLFYRERGYKLAWFKDGEMVPQVNKFLSVIQKSHDEGLNPKDYQVVDFAPLFSELEQTKDDSARAQLQEKIDVALTASYFHYASDFYRGTVNPRNLDNVEWEVKRNKIKLHKALQTILKERDSKYPYYEFEALHPDYLRLRDALKKFRQIKQQGGWPKVNLAGAKSLKPGDSTQAVVTLRQRMLGANAANSPRAAKYDPELAMAVKKFQLNHGLKPDGVVGGVTLKMMNVPVEDRIDQIIINMERWRWIPKKFEDRYIFVNIPEYTMHLYDNKKEVLNMKVVVGKALHATPIFSDKMEYIVFYPYWNVTKQILSEEVAPAVMRNPNYLDKNDMEVVKDIGNNEVEIVSPYDVDWSQAAEKSFPYRVRQRPGKRNPLGFVKFIFPNEYNVYLHDTPSDHLFQQVDRGFSHGCVRLEKPFELAQYLLKDQAQWTPTAIKEAMHGGEERYVNLKQKMPVYIVYFTTWVDEQGEVHFRDDVYGHDKQLEQAYFG